MAFEAKTLAISELHKIDFSRSYLAIGLDIEGAEWLKLDAEDMRWLVKLLRLRITPEGGELLPAAAEMSPGLETLARWCEAAIEWKERRR